MDFPSSVRRVTRVRDGKVERIYEKARGGRKRGSKGLRDLGKVNRKEARAVEAAAAKYLTLVKKSDRKRKDGWLKDLPRNAAKAVRAGLDVLTD